MIPLRPLGVGEILDGAFTSIRRNPRATFGFAAVLLTITTVVTTIVTLILVNGLGQITVPSGGTSSPTQLTHDITHLLEVALPLLGLSALLTFLVDIALTGMLTVVIGRSVFGHQVSASEAWELVRTRLLPLLGVTLLILCIVLAPVLVVLVLGIIAAVAGAPAGLVAAIFILGLIAAFCVLVWFGIMLQMAGPVVVLERQSVTQSLVRSWNLVRGSFWRVLGITLLAALIVIVAGFVLQLPFRVLSLIANSAVGGVVAGTIIGAIGAILAGAVTRPISAGVTVLLYVDLRMRREGFDLVLQSATSGDTPRSGDEFASVWRPGPAAASGSATAGQWQGGQAGMGQAGMGQAGGGQWQPGAGQWQGGTAGQPYGGPAQGGQPYGGQPQGGQWPGGGSPGTGGSGWDGGGPAGPSDTQTW